MSTERDKTFDKVQAAFVMEDLEFILLTKIGQCQKDKRNAITFLAIKESVELNGKVIRI